jgi:hypothetical protein
MAETQHENPGFSQIELIIYKLGHIETSIDNLIKNLADSGAKTSGLESRVKTLEDSFRAVRNYGLGAFAVLGGVIVILKVVLTEWLKSLG